MKQIVFWDGLCEDAGTSLFYKKCRELAVVLNSQYPLSDIDEIREKVWTTIFQEHHALLIDGIQHSIDCTHTNIFQQIVRPKHISVRVINRYLTTIKGTGCTTEECDTIFSLITD